MTEESAALANISETAITEAQPVAIAPAPSDAAAAAAKWFADCLRAPARQDNGDAFQSAFASFVADKTFEMPTEEQLSRFEDLLAETIRAGMARHHSSPFMIGVDYGPDHYLATVYSSVFGNANITTFPCKTMMLCTADFVTVSCGYRAPSEVIWPRKADLPGWRQHFWDWIEQAKRYGFDEQPALRAATPHDAMCELRVAEKILDPVLLYLTLIEGECGENARKLLDLMYPNDLRREIVTEGKLNEYGDEFRFSVINRRPPSPEGSGA